MWERLKTLALMALILLSLHLTSLFWLQVHAPAPLMVAPGRPIQVDAKAPSSYIDLFSPFYMLVHGRGENYRLNAGSRQFEQLWTAFKKAVEEAENPGENKAVELARSQASDWQRIVSNSVSYEFRFAGPLQLHFWWLAASKNTMIKLSEEVYFDRLLISNGDSSIYFMNTSNSSVWRWKWSSQPNSAVFPPLSELNLLASQRVREVRVPGDVAVVPGSQLYTTRNAVSLPEVLATLPISETNKPSIVKQFFSITPRMRKTDEPENGEVIETYITAKQQVLRLHNNGLLEYTETAPQAGANWATTPEQFEQAFNFVLSHGGWPSTSKVSGMQKKNVASGKPSLSFDFMQFYNGIPVLDLQPTLSIEVAGDGIKRYERKMYNIIQKGYFQFEVRSAEDALSVASSALAGREVADLYLAYYQRPYSFSSNEPFGSEPMYLYPVWVVELATGEQLMLHAFKLLNDPGLISGP